MGSRDLSLLTRVAGLELPLWKFFRAAIVAYFAFYMILAGPLTCGLWVRGGHPTLEHQAHHALLERLGIIEHHKNGLGLDGAGTPAISRSILAVLLVEPNLFAVQNIAGLFFPLSHCIDVLSRDNGDEPILVASLVLFDGYFPTMLSSPPPEPPPRFSS